MPESQVRYELEDATPLLGKPAELREMAERQGVLLFRGLLPRQRVLELRRQMLEILDAFDLLDASHPLEDGVADKSAFAAVSENDRNFCGAGVPRAVYERVQKLEAFHALPHEPALLQFYRTLFEEQVLVHPRHIARLMASTPGMSPTPPHQDHIHIQGTRRAWTCWVPIGDVPRQRGGLAVLPASHHRGIYRGHEADGAGGWEIDVCENEPVYLSTDYEAGDVLTFHSLTVHKATTPTDHQHFRLSCDFRYQPMSEPVEANSLKVHCNALTWDQVYAEWAGHDHLKYYWRDLPLRFSEYDPELRWQKEAICDEGVGPT